MSTASFALPFAPSWDKKGWDKRGWDERTLASVRRRAVLVGRGLSFGVSSVALAAFLWLLLAGPGFMSDGASTLAGRGGRVMVKR